MLSKLKQLFHRRQRSVPHDDELDWLNPPSDLLDVTAWDRYWTEQVRHGLGPPLFDMVTDDRELVSLMHNEGMKSVLCAGSGIS